MRAELSHSAVTVTITLARASATREIIVRRPCGACARKRLISLEGTFSHSKVCACARKRIHRVHEVRYFYVKSPASSHIKLRSLMYELAGKHPSTSLTLAYSTLRGILLSCLYHYIIQKTSIISRVALARASAMATLIVE